MTTSHSETPLQLVPPLHSSGKRLPIVAIDGPAGAGKSTAARLLAYQLGFVLIDTGALYRCLALQAMEQNVKMDDGLALAKLCRELKFQFSSLERPEQEDILSNHEPTSFEIPKLHVYCNSLDVTEAIRRPELGMAASNVSKLPEVRAALLDVQRSFGDQGGIVMEGRDIGTVIFPKAEIKFFLTASVESRAKRRWEELQAAGIFNAFEQVLKETQMRDDQDRGRSVAPLRQAEGALLIDSSSRTLGEVVLEMFQTVRSHLKEGLSSV